MLDSKTSICLTEKTVGMTERKEAIDGMTDKTITSITIVTHNKQE